MKFGERLRMGALAGLLGLGGVAASRESQGNPMELKPTTSSPALKSKDTLAPLPPLQEENSTSDEEQIRMGSTFLEGEQNQIEVPPKTIPERKREVLGLLQDMFAQDGGITEGSLQGKGYLNKKLTVNGETPLEMLSLTQEGKAYATILFDEEGYTFKPTMGEKEISVNSLPELGSVVDEYEKIHTKVEQAHKQIEKTMKTKDFEAQINARMALEDLLQDTNYFKK